MDNQETIKSSEAARKGPNYAAAALWASAFMLAALTVVQAGRLPGSSAFAGTANAGRDGTSSVTINTGLGPDNRPYEALWVVDNRTEMLAIYFIENANSGEKSLQLRYMASLPDMFRLARGGN